MAPAVKRSFDLISDDFSAFDSSAIEVAFIDSICSPTNTKKLKLANTKNALKNDLSTYLDFSPEHDAVVPSATDLVNKSEAWLSDSIPGSPVECFHELPDSDSDTDIKPSLFDLESPFASTEFPNDFGLNLITDVPDSTLSTNQLLLGVVDLAVQPLEPKLDIKPTIPTTSTTPSVPIVQPKRENISTTSTATIKKTASRSYEPNTSSANFSSQSMTEESKSMSSRWAHNSTERKRRCEIRRLFSGLRDLFPDLHGDDRTSNINTLNRAISCVTELTRKNIEHESQLRLLREKNAMLKAKKLKSQRARISQIPVVQSSTTQSVANISTTSSKTISHGGIKATTSTIKSHSKVNLGSVYKKTYLDNNKFVNNAISASSNTAKSAAASFAGARSKATKSSGLPCTSTPIVYTPKFQSKPVQHNIQNPKNPTSKGSATVSSFPKSSTSATGIATTPTLVSSSLSSSTTTTKPIIPTYPSTSNSSSISSSSVSVNRKTSNIISNGKALPSALRQLMDHNTKGVQEIKPLPPRRKTVRKF